MRMVIWSIFVLMLACDVASASSAKSEAEVRQLIGHWEAAFQAKDLDGVMSVYVPGTELVAFDVVPPLQRLGYDAYRNNYKAFFAQYDGPLVLEMRNLEVNAGADVAFIHCLERMSGTLKSGEKSEVWLRVTSGLRKIHGVWRIVHDHVSAPVNFESGKAVLDLTP